MRHHRTRFELELVRHRVRSCLRDPSLNPALIAAACEMSLRKLHGLFAASEDTFGSYVRRMRLESAHAIFSDGDNWATVAEVASSLGFKSAATFYRVYGDAFGETPGDTRRAALRRLYGH